ncbi:ROK family transcriptional regulator [Plantibacter sp. ME-Dv--P-122b]|uniref:ROK family transcriptional regulator n=1 Tax=Plantibacter sp. ME-Dv--P-122b TaxID=3040300 RepID=UPI00254BE7F1|nr:ROK family transcriptional regulator [Plantibacter sp. ME-Dv--P-122b]
MSIGTASGHTLEDIRRRNVSAVLALVHGDGGLSRAEITRRTGLSRSSVATVITDLELAGVVSQEAAPPATRVGRPSPVVIPTDRFLAVSVNPDVDGVRVALCALGGRIVAQTFRPSERVVTPNEAAAMTADAVRELRAGLPDSRLVALCAAMPGRVDKTGEDVVYAPHLRWRNVPFASMLQDATGIPSRVAFDAAVGLAAERHWGAARDTADAVYLYGGPGGIGASALVDGRILQGANGGVARLGHLLVAPDGPVCSCGNVGCLTTVVSAHAIAAATGAASVALADLRAALAEGSAARTAGALDRQLEYVATAIRVITNIYDPEIVVMGGFFGLLLDQGDGAIRRRLSDETISALRSPARLVEPRLGESQLLAGASDVAFAALLRDPLGFTAREATA